MKKLDSTDRPFEHQMPVFFVKNPNSSTPFQVIAEAIAVSLLENGEMRENRA